MAKSNARQTSPAGRKTPAKGAVDDTPSSVAGAGNALAQKVSELDAITYYLDSILGNMSQGLLFVDFNGTVTTYNNAAEKILGVPAQNVLFRTFWSNFDDLIFGFSMRQALSHRRAGGLTTAALEASPGVVRELEVETSILEPPKAGGAPAIAAMQGLIILIRDITEMRRLQAIAQRHDRLQELGEMAAMVAHEIRNPLGGIKGFAALLVRDLKEQPELEKMAKYIVEGTDNLNKLVTTILNYARPVKPQLETIDLRDLLQELYDHVRADSNVDPRITLELEQPPEKVGVPVDKHLLKSALLNLIVNAIQAMPQGGVLRLETQVSGENGEVTVADAGVGIAPENMKKLYSPFFTTRANGNGFGLAEVLKIVQAHGGTIDVESALGKGTKFTIKIPIKMKGSS